MLNIKGLDCFEIHEGPDWYRIEVTEKGHDAKPLCETCVAFNVIKFGTRTRCFHDLPMHGKKVEIIYHLRRFRCLDCGSVITEEVINEMDDKRAATVRLIDYVVKHSANRTFVSLAAELGVDEKTIRNIVKDAHNRTMKNPAVYTTPRILGIDEAHLVKQFRCVITNIETATLYDILPTRGVNVVTRRLMQIPDRHSIEVICMDMHRPYKAAAKAALPGAKAVIDKYHIIRMGNEGMETIRKKIKEMPKAARTSLKHERFKLLKRAHRLRPFEQLNVEVWSSNYPALGAAYLAKEEFFDIWKAADRYEAEQRYVEWFSNLPPSIEWAFKPLLTAVSNWHNEIFNYFDYRYTNATTEALNGIIKIINRAGRGYTFDTLRNKLLAHKGEPVTTLKTFIESDSYFT